MATENQIKELLNSMASSIGADNIALYEKLSEGVVFKTITSPEEFRHAFLYPHEKYIDGLIRSKITKDRDAAFILEHSDFIETYYQKWIEKIEGPACCADKSRTIMRRLLNFYKDGDEIVFDYDQEYTYHLPKRVFRTEGEIIQFYEAIRSLWYGNAEKYIVLYYNLIRTPTTDLGRDEAGHV